MNTFNKIIVAGLLTIAVMGSGYAFHLMVGPIAKMNRAIASQSK